jgi:hypothetical protein
MRCRALATLVVDRDVHPFGDRERSPTCLGKFGPDHCDLLRKHRGGRRFGSHEGIAVPDCSTQCRPEAAAEPDRRVRLLEGLGSTAPSSNRQKRPWN